MFLLALSIECPIFFWGGEIFTLPIACKAHIHSSDDDGLMFYVLFSII